MDIREYISSGAIESYVLGQLPDKECRELESLAKQYPEIKTEIEATESAMMSFAAKTPRADIKQNILSKIELKDARVVPLAKQGPSVITWLAAASVMLLIGSGIYNFILAGKLRTAENQMAALSAEKEKYVKDFERQSASYQVLAEEMEIAMKPENKKVMLKGMDAAPTALAAVYWNQDTKDVYIINVSSLPMPSGDKQYQLWAIVDGKPVDAGVFEMDSIPFHKMKAIAGAQAFAVTLEKKGGSPTPTMTAMYLMGNV